MELCGQPMELVSVPRQAPALRGHVASSPSMRTLRVHIEDIAKWHPWFYVEPHIVSCAAVLSRYGRSPAVLDVQCSRVKSPWLRDSSRFRLQVAWSDETAMKAI